MHYRSPDQRITVSKLISAALELYLGSLILYFLLRLVSGDRLWPVALGGIFLPWLLLLCFPIVGWLIWRRRSVSAGLAGLLIAAFALLYGPLFLPRVRPAYACPDCTHLRVMTFNLGAWLAEPEALVSIINDSGADLIAIQELGPDHAALLEISLLERYPYRVLNGNGIPGTGFLSRYPIMEWEEFYLVDGSGLPHLCILLDVEGTPLTVISAHPPPPRLVGDPLGFYNTAIRSADIRALAALVPDDAPFLLVGDFNTTDQSDDYTVLRKAGLEDAYREAGWGLGLTFSKGWRYAWRYAKTLPLGLLFRIDYIWHTDHFVVESAQVGPDAGSDHLPVIADLVWVER
jgi:endonuclease/exonuclease/phosphatase (EEP) superfamily protein YafD